MALRALHVWKLDDEGKPLLDRNGEKIPHKKAGIAKTYKELNPAEKRSFDDALKHYDMRKKARAVNLLGEILDAKDVMASTP